MADAPVAAATPAATLPFIPFAVPSIGDEEIAEVVDTLRSPWITTGPKTRRFEAAFAEAVGAPGVIAVNSCTAALHTALACLDIGPGDEVITTPVTFAATVNVIEHVGARPVLVDVEPDTLNLDPERVAAAVGSRTRAIVAVHYAGHPAELDALHALAAPRGVTVIEDAAHALPASFAGRRVGSSANPVAFSFYATKNLTTGEGGMLTGDPALIERARPLVLHGMSRDAWRRYERGGSWRYEILRPGFKYNMTDVQAALGLAQLRKLPAFHERRTALAAAYTRALAGVAALQPPVARAHVEHAWHLYPLRLHLDALRIDRDRFIDELGARGIGTSVHFIPVHLHPYYRDRYGYAPDAFPIAYDNYRRLVSLPLHPGLSDDDVGRIVDAVLDVVAAHRR